MNIALRSAGSVAVGLSLLLSPLAAYAFDGSWFHHDNDEGTGSDSGPSLAICTDGIDNDEDGVADADDSDCAPYYRMLRVDKYVVGTSTPASDFSFTITGDGVPSLGTFPFGSWGENFFPNTLVGEYHIVETPVPAGFTVSYNNCGTGTEGDFPLTIPVNGADEVCTITNTWVGITPPATSTPPTESTSTPPVATSTPPVATTTPETGGNDTTKPEGSSSRSGGSSHRHTSSGGGEVLGAATCGPLLTSYVREGEGSKDVVTTLQTFLAKELGIEIPLTGVYDAATKDAVNQFQLKYWEDVLAPWVNHGLKSDHTPTGYVFKTTLHKINKLFCASLTDPEPKLP